MTSKQRRISYNVWIEIERYDDRAGQGQDMDLPSKLATFATYRQACEFVEGVARLSEGINHKPRKVTHHGK